jgi:hypothetical protein
MQDYQGRPPSAEGSDDPAVAPDDGHVGTGTAERSIQSTIIDQHALSPVVGQSDLDSSPSTGVVGNASIFSSRASGIPNEASIANRSLLNNRSSAQRPLSALAAAAASSRARTARFAEDKTTSSQDNTEMPSAEKDADDPSTPEEAKALVEQRNYSTKMTTLSRLLGAQTAPSASRQVSDVGFLSPLYTRCGNLLMLNFLVSSANTTYSYGK